MKQIEYKSNIVVTSAILADRLGTTQETMKVNFSRNRERYEEGKHFFLLSGEDLNLYVTNCNLQISPMTRSLYLWTERGAFNHVKSLGTDQAWDAYQELVEKYFRVREVVTHELSRRELAQLIIKAEDEKEALQLQINTLSPKAHAADVLLLSNDDITIGEFGKTIGVGQNNLFKKLREDGFLISQGSKSNLPYEKYITAGYFSVREVTVSNANVKLFRQTMITPKGQVYLTNKYKS